MRGSSIAGVVVAVGAADDGEVGGVEQVEDLLLERALGQDDGEHGNAFQNRCWTDGGRARVPERAGRGRLALGPARMALATAHLAQQQRRLDRSHRRPRGPCPRSIQGSPQRSSACSVGVAGQHTEADRDAAAHGDPGQPVGDSLGTRTRSAGCRRGSRRRARPPRRDPCPASALATTGSSKAPGTRTTVGSSMPQSGQGPLGAGQQARGDLAVPASRDDRHARPRQPALRRPTAHGGLLATRLASSPRANGDRRAWASRNALLTAAGSSRAGRSLAAAGVVGAAVSGLVLESGKAGQVVAHPVALGREVAQVLRRSRAPAAAPGRRSAGRSPRGRPAWPGCW